MANGTIIRGAKRSDARAFLRLLVSLANFEKLKPPTEGARRRIIRDIFERKVATLFLACRNRVPIGYALCFYTYSSFLAKPTLYLEDIFVLEEFRGSGVGRSLVLRCAREASRHGCGRMEWSVLNWNRRAIRFYRGMGARMLDEWSVFRLNETALRRLERRVK